MALPFDPMDKVEVRFKGIYDFEGLYKVIRQWFFDRKYDFHETKYKDKVSSPFGNEVEVNMSPWLKINEFAMYHVDIKTHFYDVKEFETVIDGEKRMVTEGRFWIVLHGWVEFDYNNRFKTKFEKWVLKFLVRTALKKYYEVLYFDGVTYDVYELEALIKKHLKMDSSYNAYP